MQLTRFTDYSLRVLLYLGVQPDRWVTIRQISDAYGISRNHLMKVVSFLANEGYVKSQRGPGGGICLRIEPAEINLADVIMDAEGDMNLVECLREDVDCVLKPGCPLRGALANALQAFTDALREYSLADLIEPRDELARRLGIRERIGIRPA